jgi:hypothetical protein
LHYKWTAEEGDGLTSCRIYYNGVKIYEAGVYTGQTSYIDLYNTVGLTPPTVGTAYELYFTTDLDNDTIFTAYYLLESDLTSL